MLTRRQRILLDLLTQCHRLDFHPSPPHLGGLLVRATEWPMGTSPAAVRAELVRLLEAGSILHVEKGSGTAPTKYALADCDCDRCKSHRL